MNESSKRVKSVVLGVHDFTTFQSSDRALWHWNNCFGRGITSQSARRAFPDRARKRDSINYANNNAEHNVSGEDGISILEVVMDRDSEIADNLAPGLSKSTVQKKTKLRRKQVSKASTMNEKFNISFDTRVAVVYASYRIVFAIDYSPSMRRIEHITGKPCYSLLRENISLFLRDLVKKIEFPYSNITYTPDIYISVIVFGYKKRRGQSDASKSYADPVGRKQEVDLSSERGTEDEDDDHLSTTSYSSTLSSSSSSFQSQENSSTYSYRDTKFSHTSNTSKSYSQKKYRKARKAAYKRKVNEEKAHIVIIQGFALSPKNVEVLIDQLMERLKALERDEIGGSDIFDGTAKTETKAKLQHRNTLHKRGNSLKSNEFNDLDKKTKVKKGGAPLQDTFNACLNALDKLLPDACPMIVLFTDGVVELPIAHDYESTLMRLSRKDIPCHIVRIGTTDLPSSSWGCVSDPGTLLYLSRATGGVFFQGSSNMADNIVSCIRSSNNNNNSESAAVDSQFELEASTVSIDNNSEKIGHSNSWRQKELLYRFSCLADGAERNMGIVVSSVSSARKRAGMNRSGVDLYNSHLLGVNSAPHYSDTPMYSGRIFGNLKKEYSGSMENHGYLKVSENLPLGTLRWYEEYPVVNDLNLVKSIQAIDYAFPWAGPPPPSPCWKEAIKEYKLLVNFERLLECRSWEGFCVTYTHTRDVLQLSDDSKSFEMTFTMSWKPGVDILYNICSDDVLNLATSSGPFKRTVEASVRVELVASVEFLRNFVRTTNKTNGGKKYPRLHKFLNTIHEIDKVLVHLSSPPPLRELENKRINVKRDGLKSIIGSSRNMNSTSSSNKKTATFFVIFGKLPLSMWNRWFCVEQVDAFVVGTTVFPKRQAKNLANILSRWSTQRLSKDVYMKLLEVDDEGTEGEDDPQGNDIGNFSLNTEIPSVQERSAGCAFCLTKCKWRSPTSVVVNIAFHAAKPKVRNSIKKHLSKNMLDSGFMIVTPYEQHVARSFYWDLINQKNPEQTEEELQYLYERVLKTCTISTVSIVNDVPQVDTVSTFKKIVINHFVPLGNIDDTFFLRSQFKGGENVVNRDYHRNHTSTGSSMITISEYHEDIPFFLHVKYHEKTPRITLSCYTLPFDKLEAEKITTKVTESMKTDFNTLIAEEILETMINERSFSQAIVSKLFNYLDCLYGSGSDIVIVEHATTLGRDPIFVEALIKQANWNVIAPHVYKKSNVGYWVLLSVLDDDHTKIHIFGGGDWAKKEIENVIAGIDLASRRAEQSSLLQNLYENRACSTDRLILANGSDGMLACPSVLRVPLELHERVQVHVALRALAAIPVLRPFAVGNRPNCYVLSPMFYLRIQEDKPVKKASKRQLLLEVFGLGEAGVDINTHLMNMVKNKLEGVALGHLLRHTSLHLSVADLSLIQPLNSEPVHKFDVRFPAHLCDVSKFLRIFNQHAKRLLMPLKIYRKNSEPILQLRTLSNQLIPQNSTIQRNSNKRSNKSGGIHVVENAYLVNGGSKMVANSNLSIGKGLAVVYFEFRRGKQLGSRRWSLPPWHHEGGNSLYIQIWSAGSVNLEKLYNLIEEFVEKSILTYALEDDFLLRKDGPLGSDMEILHTAYKVGVPDLFQWASKRLVPAWAKPTIIRGLADALEGVVVEEKKDGVFAMSTVIVRQPEGKLLQAIASVRSNGIQLWTYKWRDRKSLKVTIEKMMHVIEENKHILDRCLESKMGIAKTPFYSESYMTQWTNACEKVEDIVGSHVSILMNEKNKTRRQKEVERATLAIIQTCKSNRQRVKGLPGLRKILNTYRITKSVFSPLILINDAAAAAKAYARFLSSTLPIRRLRNKGDDAVLYGNFPDPVLFVVSGHGGLKNSAASGSNTLDSIKTLELKQDGVGYRLSKLHCTLVVNILVLPGAMPAGPQLANVVSTLRLQAWAYDTALIRVYSVTSGLSIRGASDICTGLDELITRYGVPPKGSKNMLQKHLLQNWDVSLLMFISKNGKKYGCRGHADGSIDFVLLSPVDDRNNDGTKEQVSGIVRNSKSGMWLYVIVRDCSSHSESMPLERCENWLQKTFYAAQMDRRREAFWSQAIACQNLSREATGMLGKGSVKLSHIDPTLKELLQSIATSDESEDIKSQKTNDGSNGQYFVMHGIFDSMIYAGDIADNSVLLWTKKNQNGQIPENNKDLVESWVVDECIRLSVRNLGALGNLQ